ncbi:MAG: 16S rRNA (uracil(1498)-N(3))-methyltransferase [Candidatus Kapabacteria bacterium]|nr:16S rRNA (uracil(1498)-N(3))-methyltransferase [Candidatus Kapabacteria bacterium]
MDWLRIDGIPELHREIAFTGETLRHAAALRLRPGESVGLLDGRGTVAQCVVTASAKGSCTVRVMSIRHEMLPADITIAIGVPDNRDRLEFALEKCTELGARRIVLLECQRSQRQSIRLDRLQQKAEAAMLQCGRAWTPELVGPISVQACLDMFETATVVVGDQHGEQPSAVSGPLLLMVGPEGGFTDDERARIDVRTPRAWRIGEHRLRTETAAVVLTAAATMASSSE